MKSEGAEKNSKNKMRKEFIILLLVLFTLNANAQQLGMYSHYFYNPMVYNPAFTGSGDVVNVMLINHSQWVDFKGAPKLTVLTLDGRLFDKKTGLGINLITDRKGITNRTGGNLSYSHLLIINDEMHLLLGMSFGIVNQTIDFSKALTTNTSDPILFTDSQRKTTFDGNAGLAFVWKQLEFGAAIPQLLGNKINYVDNSNIRVYYTQTRHYMLSLKYKFFIAKEKGISIAPQGLVRFVPNTPFQFDSNINLDWKDKCWIGATYKSNYAVAANVGFCLYKQLYLGYSYDFIVGNIGKYSGMSQEIMINFKFDEHKKTEVAVKTITKEKEAVAKNKDYEDLMESLQVQVNESDKKIKELDAKIQRQSKGQNNKNNTSSKTDSKHDLNNLIFLQLLGKIEAMFANTKASPPEIQELRNEIASFLDSEFADTTAQKTLKKQYELLNQSKDAPTVTVKGIIVLDTIGSHADYSTIRITISNKATDETIGTYSPNPKTGKYLLLLSPGKKYMQTIENNRYKTYFKEFSPADSKVSYEMTQEIRLKEE